MRRQLGLWAACLLLCVIPFQEAQASQFRVTGPTAVHEWARKLLIAPPPGPVSVRIGPCPIDPTAQGCHISGRISRIWLNPATGGLDEETFYHELGHVFESYLWDLHWEGGDGGFVPRLFRKLATVLFDDPGPHVLYSIAWSERFAEGYGLCARFQTIETAIPPGYWGFRATPESHLRTCALIGRMAERYRQMAAQPVPGTPLSAGR